MEGEFHDEPTFRMQRLNIKATQMKTTQDFDKVKAGDMVVALLHCICRLTEW